MALPSVLFSSSVVDYKANEFVKAILEDKYVHPAQLIVDDVESVEFHLENKYYSTTVRLCSTNSRTIGDKEFADSLEAFVHYFNPNEVQSFELTKAWLSYLSHIEPEIQMLVCKTSRLSDAVSRSEVLKWCFDNHFELVELKPDQDDEEDDDFPETNGLPRILQALHAHTWPNLIMKDSSHIQSPYLRQMMKEQHLLNQQQEKTGTSNDKDSQTQTQDSPQTCSDKTSACSSGSTTDTHKRADDSNASKLLGDKSQNACRNKISMSEDVPSPEGATGLGAATNGSSSTSLSQESALLGDVDWKSLMVSATQPDAPLEENDTGVEEFEQLFIKLQVMKDKAEHMHPDERKTYAEKVAISFWKAIGGDEGEIGDLDGVSD